MIREEIAAKLGETIFAGAMMEMNRHDLGLLALETMDEIARQEDAAVFIAATRRAALEEAAKIAEAYEPDRQTSAKQAAGLMVGHVPPQQAIAFAIRRLIGAA